MRLALDYELLTVKAECEDLEQQVSEFSANILLGPRELFEVPRDQLVIAHGMYNSRLFAKDSCKQ